MESPILKNIKRKDLDRKYTNLKAAIKKCYAEKISVPENSLQDITDEELAKNLVKAGDSKLTYFIHETELADITGNGVFVFLHYAKFLVEEESEEAFEALLDVCYPLRGLMVDSYFYGGKKVR